MVPTAAPPLALPAPVPAALRSSVRQPGPGFDEVRCEVTEGLQGLHACVDGTALPDAARGALDRLDTLAAGLQPDSSIETKYQMRQSLWAVRQALDPTSPPLETRRAFESVRSACLDNTFERSMRALPCSRQVVRPRMSEVANFDVVDDHVLRGALPTQAGADWLVATADVRTVIDLTTPPDDQPWAPVEWKNVARFNIPVKDYEAPTYEQMKQIVGLLDEHRDGNVFIHCKAGIGRTGVAVACWRVSHGWDAEEAIRAESLGSYDASWKQAPAVREFATRWAAEHHTIRA